MVDEANPPATVATAPIATPAAEPVAPSATVETPTPTPESPPVTNPVLAETPPVVAPSTTAEPSAAAAELAPTVIGAEPKPADAVKPVETPTPEGEKPTEPKKDEASQSAEPAPLPIYEPWTLPDGIKLDDTQAGEFNKLLGEFQASTKAETAAVQKFGQELVSRHVAEVKESIERTHKTYQAAWLKQAEDWKQAFISDPEIGGNRQETTVAAANEFIVTHGGTPAHQTEFRALMQQTGLGNHPAMIRILANAKNSPEFTEGKPLAGAPVVAKQSKSQKFYGKKTA